MGCGTQMNTADSAWMLTSTALVLFMVPGLALFYGGLVAEKNVIAMMTQSIRGDRDRHRPLGGHRISAGVRRRSPRSPSVDFARCCCTRLTRDQAAGIPTLRGCCPRRTGPCSR